MKDHMVLGKDCIYSADPAETGLNNNVIVCGSSGCGKTMSVSEPLLLETWNRSIISTVTKRRIVQKYKEMFRQRGYTVLDLDFVNPARGNTGYDPLKYVASYQDISFLARSIVEADPRKGKSNADPYWDESATSLLCAEISYILATQSNSSLADVINFHNSIRIEVYSNGEIETNVDDKFARLEQSDPVCYPVTCWKTFRQLPARTAGCVFSTLNTTLDTIFTKDILQMMAVSKPIDFERLALRKSVLFVTTSPVSRALHCFINMFYGQMFKQLFEFAENRPDGTLPIPVHVLCDDFATGGRILNFDEYISIFREKGISVTLLLQSESQLESMYGPDAATTIINNCDSYIYMGGMDIKTGQHISLRLDAPLDDVLYMPIGREILFRRGQRPVITERYNILDNETYRQETKRYEELLKREKARTRPHPGRNFRGKRTTPDLQADP